MPDEERDLLMGVEQTAEEEVHVANAFQKSLDVDMREIKKKFPTAYVGRPHEIIDSDTGAVKYTPEQLESMGMVGVWIKKVKDG